MRTDSIDEALTQDDIDCLWAIAHRRTIQDRLVHSRGEALQKRGLIAVSYEWPTLTAKGRTLLDDLSARAKLDVYRERHGAELKHRQV